MRMFGLSRLAISISRLVNLPFQIVSLYQAKQPVP
jgi:hypothetical protein